MRFAFLFFALLLLPFLVSADVVINEIMYDLEGSDSGREWVEIFNNGNEQVDISGWKFYEQKTNHRLNLYQGDVIVGAGQYAIIVDKPEKFLIDWPSFSGTIFDSSFSLKNSGENLTLRDRYLNDIDSIIYNSDWGGKGDGNSLQKASRNWIGASPTPGLQNSGVQQEEISEKELIPVSEPEPEPQTQENNTQPQSTDSPAEFVVADEMDDEPVVPPKQNVSRSTANMDAPDTDKLTRQIDELKRSLEKMRAIANKSQTVRPPSSNTGKDIKHSVFNMATKTQTANIITVAQNGSWGIKEWLAIILGLGIFGGIGFVFARRRILT